MSERPVHVQLCEAANRWSPPDALRAQVLGAAATRVRPAVTWSDRVWFSRRWRAAAVAAVAAAMLLDFTFAPRGGWPGTEPPASARETAQAVDDIARQAGLGADQARLFAQRAFVLASRPDPGASADRTDMALLERGDAR
jgi:hypothetical protein